MEQAQSTGNESFNPSGIKNMKILTHYQSISVTYVPKYVYYIHV